MLDLSNVTLVALSSNRIVATKLAIEICLREVRFAEVLFFSHVPTGYKTVLVEPMDYAAYNTHCVKTLPLHVNTDFMLKIHWDGFVVNPHAWTDDFFAYDFIGAPWPFLDGMVGNGGFSLRSKKLLDAQKVVFAEVDKVDVEDVAICRNFRTALEMKGIKFPGPQIGYRFSTEIGNWHDHYSFGFHGYQYNDPLGMKEILSQPEPTPCAASS